jgi:hypothetical protein
MRHRTVQLDGDPEAVMGEAVHAALEFYLESLELLSSHLQQGPTENRTPGRRGQPAVTLKINKTWMSPARP